MDTSPTSDPEVALPPDFQKLVTPRGLMMMGLSRLAFALVMLASVGLVVMSHMVWWRKLILGGMAAGVGVSLGSFGVTVLAAGWRPSRRQKAMAARLMRHLREQHPWVLRPDVMVSDYWRKWQPMQFPGTTHRRTYGALGVFLFLSVCAIAATGGILSPMLPLLIVFCLFIGSITPKQATPPFVGIILAIVWVLAWAATYLRVPGYIPGIFGGDALVPQSKSLVYAQAAAFSLFVMWSVFGANRFQVVFLSAVQKALDARDEALQSHTEHAATLTALSGEIAHELKNPLASVKGLATLIGRDLEGKPAERLAVLQREVGRMEEILEGFLNFSRPLLPLQQEEQPLRNLCDSVVALHEGLAQEREVKLTVMEEEAVSAWCDARKVKQVVINLVQNALDASPPGSTVEVVLLGGRESRVEVRDRGPGLPASVRQRLFEPGVTTKARGSGLGLALARGLVRQHGGELTLGDREGGGCVAALTLPARQPVSEVERETA
ncbi:HAMP domain-containing histidine kinase [Pyxidicoccus parkwayensis]|uniref:histidine kinase n=1 Tax=Pyxidicoccus parkwayensis TaxID=2813578 RepID=A0ABX7NUB8_9BACT|nr:HAMP domain-containing sensor histidine kinase [Pyxidicoccus parkwaysis]QSQ21969.1 HAMP domain-containing histidine kinase [Pyxidicoccus parkwaysis]